MSYDWNFNWVWNNISILFDGLIMTFKLTFISFCIGYVIAIGLVLLKTSQNKFIAFLGKIFIEIARGLPVLVTLVWLYYCLPIFIPILHISPFWVAVLGLSLNFGGLQSEIIRSGFLAIPNSQLEVARSFNLTKTQILRYITLPQAFWKTISPTLGQLVNTLKLSSLASFITVPELFYKTNSLIQDSFRPLEFYTSLAVMYLLLILPLSFLTQFIENKISERYNG